MAEMCRYLQFLESDNPCPEGQARVALPRIAMAGDAAAFCHESVMKSMICHFTMAARTGVEPVYQP